MRYPTPPDDSLRVVRLGEYRIPDMEPGKIMPREVSFCVHTITQSGLLPICSSCKKIRDDKGYWNQFEAYVEEHSEADFTYGICPECAQRPYTEIDS
jgi:hypothetical protein